MLILKRSIDKKKSVLSLKENKLIVFQSQSVRTHWDKEQEKWYFSVQDIVQILSESKDVKQYIKKMRSRDPELNINWGTICIPLPMLTANGKIRKIQTSDTEGILRIIQSISSPKAEPFKQWLAQVGSERIDEIPELIITAYIKTVILDLDSDKISEISKNLYVEEGEMNDFEKKVIYDVANLDSVVFWHRNLERGKGFLLNGFINHYPDFIVKMERLF